MSSQELFHPIRNKLVVVLDRTANAAEQATLEHAQQIKAAELNIREQIQRVQQNRA
jgi:hypothetical protein